MTSESRNPFDFPVLARRVNRECAQCGTEFRASPDAQLCTQCEYYRVHPEMAPKYFTWTKVGSEWGITAHWPEKEPLPEPGDTVTVHRKDGSESTETIAELHSQRYDRTARFTITCRIGS